jgi:hypothetical protein
MSDSTFKQRDIILGSKVMMLQRQVAGQGDWLFSEVFVFLFVSFKSLLRLVELLLMFFQLSSQLLVGFAELSILFRQFYRPRMLCVARPKDISRSFMPGSPVIIERCNDRPLWGKTLIDVAFLRLAVEKSNQYIGA